MVKLPTGKQLQAFWLFVIKNMRYWQIAERLGISRGAVKGRMYRIRRNPEFRKLKPNGRRMFAYEPLMNGRIKRKF